MLHLKKNPRAKIGSVLVSALAFGAVWGAVHVKQPTSADVLSVQAQLPAATTRPATAQSQTAASSANQASPAATPTAAASVVKKTNTTTHVS
ncbi:MAG: hypothetical protein M3P30_10140 [Chloroflexota bacterium]|nr:hypothetical protein [Chloroflexota bacterium]